MALVTEDGTGLATAESFISVADTDTRHTNHGNSTWASLTTAQKEEALRRATAYMEQAYRTRWIGCRTFDAQALSWPRVIHGLVDGWPIDSDEVPAEVANACADLALKAAAADLLADLTQTVVREKVGPIETEFSPHSPQATRYLAIDMMLAPFLKGGAMNVRLVRA